MDNQDMPERVWLGKDRMTGIQLCAGGTEYVRADLDRQPSEADVERVAVSIIQELLRQDHEPFEPFGVPANLVLPWLDQGEVDFKLVARAALDSIGGNHD